MEDKRDKVRLASDAILQQLHPDVSLKALEAFRMDRLTMLPLTDWDKQFLHDLKIAT